MVQYSKTQKQIVKIILKNGYYNLATKRFLIVGHQAMPCFRFLSSCCLTPFFHPLGLI